MCCVGCTDPERLFVVFLGEEEGERGHNAFLLTNDTDDCGLMRRAMENDDQRCNH